MLSLRVVEMGWSAAKLDEREGGGGVKACAHSQPSPLVSLSTQPAWQGKGSHVPERYPRGRFRPCGKLARFSVLIGMIGVFGLN